MRSACLSTVPTLTGGVGWEGVRNYYRDHFVGHWPADTKLVPISRTVGTDQLVDEFVLCFTHDVPMDTMLPGVAPTGKYVELPHVAVAALPLSRRGRQPHSRCNAAWRWRRQVRLTASLRLREKPTDANGMLQKSIS
jgi:hypothetical protein